MFRIKNLLFWLVPIAFSVIGFSATAATENAGQAVKAATKATITSKASKKDANEGLLLAVSEGTSGSITTEEAVAKYRPLADVIEKAIGQRVVVAFVRSFEELESGIKSKKFAFVMARPSDYPARGVRDNGYALVATAQPDGQCYLITHKDSALKSVDDLKGSTIILPEQVAYMTKFCMAELRDQGILAANSKITFAKEQGAVAWSIENKANDVGGIASYSGVAKTWEKNGNRILHKSIAQPYFPLIASNKVNRAKLKKMQDALSSLSSTETGLALLKTLGITGFKAESPERLLNLLKWLEKS
jgi:phosphonate transport system substrate-binding protein